MAISEQDLLKRDVLKSHIDSVNQRKLDMGPPSPRGNDYTRPVDEHVARGYFDETNQITPLGEEFLTLHDNGLVDNFGMATELGQSYLMSNREAQDAPVSVYRFREESGLAEAERFAALQDGEQRGFSDMIYDFATKSIPSAVETGYNIAIAPVAETALSVPRKIVELATGVDYKLPRTMSPNDITNAVAENMTGSILASEDIAAGAIYAGTMAMDDPATFGANILDKLPYGLIVRKVAGDPVMDEMVRRKTDESFAAKQAFERSRSEIAELTGAQMMETVAPIFQWAKAREQLVAENGEEAVKSKEENDRLLGSIALDPENVLSLGAGIAIKGATTAVAKTNLWAASTSLKNAALQAERAAVQSEMSAIQAGLTRPSRWIIDAELKSKALVDVGDFQGATRYDEFIKRVNLKSEVPLQRISELSATEAKLGDEITQLGSSPDIANAILASKEKAASFRNLTAGGFGLTGVVGDKIGSAMIKADDFLDAASKNMGIDSAVSALKSLPAAIGGYVMGGVPAGVTAALNVLARGKVVQSMGNFSKVLGYELMQERGSIGYWGRVAQNSTLTKAQRFLAHRADELTLGGSLMDVARPVVAGTVAAYPMNLAFEAVSNPDASGQEILTNAMGPALVFGGGSAGAGAVLQGRQAHLAQIRMADEYNFTRRMAEQSTEGSQAFSSLVPSAKRVVSTLAATYPNLNWDFSNKTESYYDPVSNTINVNPESDNPLRPLISHEVLHYVTIRNQMEPVVHSALLGDSETPGLIRNTDGTLDPEFKAFKDVYDARIANANLPPRTIEQVAEEYFNEATVDELLSMVDTGEVSRIAGRTQLGRKVKALIDATIPKITILKDLFNHTGGVRGMDGKPVMGNGLLADGIRDLPEAKAIMRKLIRDSAGQDPTRATSGDRSGTRIEIKRGDSIIDSFHSIFEVDASGNLIRDKNGDPVPLSRATDEARKSAGLIIGEAQRDKVSNGYLPKEGEMKQQANGSWQGRYIDKSLIDVLAGRGILNPKQIAILRNLSTATKGNQGLRFLLTNHPATIRNRKGKLNYATLEAYLRESVPVGFSITKDGNILVHNMSVGQLDANITARAGSKRGMDLYSGNTESIKRDVSEMMELHQKNTATDEFYQNKHGSRWKEYQQFINTVFGLMTKEQQSINPMFQSDSISSQKGQVYRTYRLDRISKATRMDGATSMPFHYENIKMNFLPDGFADATKPADTTRYLPENKIEDGFYSQLESVISKKIPTRATPEQIMATIDPTRGSGIKAEEIKWSGIEQALPKLAVDGKVTKEALLKYLADEGNVRFEEVTMGGKNKEARFNELTTMIQEIESSNTRPDNYDSLVREQQQLALDLSPEDSGAKFSQYVLPGGENYREVVLAMPEVSTTQDASSEFKAFMAEMTRKYPNEDGTFPIWSKMTDSEVNRMEVLEGEANAGKFSQTAKKKKEANYTSSHFPDIPNYVAHMRLDERTLGDGTRTLHSAEYQSDRHQEGRKKGYRENTKTAFTVTLGRNTAYGNFPTEKAAKAWIQEHIPNRADEARIVPEIPSSQDGTVADAPFRTTWPLQLFKRQLRDAVEGGFDAVSWDVGETQNDRFDLSKSIDSIEVDARDNTVHDVRVFEKSGSVIDLEVDGGTVKYGQFAGKRLDEVIGKDMADKILSVSNETSSEFSGDGLKMGGSGMRGFYDTMLPKEIGKYVKQWGGKVEKSEIGQSMSKDEIDMYDLEDATPEELAQLKAEGMVKGDAVPIWRVDITPEMRKISETGQTRYLPEASGKKFKPSEITARDIDEIAKEVGGGKLGGGSKRFGAFMRAMNDKEGGISIRDVIKSYAITQSSIQRGEIANNSLRKSWPDHPFTEAKIRPEDAFAKLLQTKDGQDYLDSAEKGIYNKSAAGGMIEKFKSFGLHNTLEKHLEQSVRQFYPKANELLSAIKDIPASEFIDYVQKNFKGISFGKTGFFLGNIGRGDIPTFDSRQSKLVYGNVVTNKKKVIMDQIDRLPKLGIEVPKEYEQYAQTLLHHEVWDRLNQTDTDHAPIKDTMLRYLPEAVDADYMKAVKSGDVKTQQRMVDEAAKAAGYDGGFYHGTIRRKFNVFKKDANTRNDYGRFGRGFYFTKEKRVAAIYAGKNPFSGGDSDIPEGATIFSVYLKMNSPKIVDARDISMPETKDAAQSVTQKLIDAGHDSVIGTVVGKIHSPNTEYVVFDSNQIKSADPITRDDSGNVIPLSQRFKPTTSDIRYLPEGDKKVKIAININDSGQKFTEQILNGEKTIETRGSINNALQSYLGQRVGIARTGIKNPQTGRADTKIVGYATIGKLPIRYSSEEEFRKDENKHLVKAGSEFDIKPNSEKFGYELTDIVRVDPFSPQSTNIKFSIIDTTRYLEKVKSKATSKNKTLAGQIRKMKE